jgi:CRISPR-associated endonuclease/helicase Cas3
MAALWQRFQEHHSRFPQQPADTVGRVRQEVYRACLDAAEQPPGLFRLSVPTGGGKTLSAIGFALRHALHHGHKRVIVAVPFISITEQTVAVYRGVFERPNEPPVVLEHHSGVAGGDQDDEQTPGRQWAKLAAENWDAPLIVTTTVQLFESLFAHNRSRTRKLHNLAQSVIIVDEAQALPPRLLSPILDGLRQMCEHYGATVVLSTATQPAFEAIPEFARVNAREIVPAPGRFFQQLRRVEYEWRHQPALSWAEVAAIMWEQPQALAVVNTKKDAMALLDALDDPQALHLSTLLCGAHRYRVIVEVRRRLAAGDDCRLVSTQVVEAGVDLDFPLVLRALGPLDSIIQAAGRCNREGRMKCGRVVVFGAEEGTLPPGAYKTATGVTRSFLGRGDLDPDDPAVSYDYFQQLFQLIDHDSKAIQELRQRLDYPEVARQFRMIDDDTVSVAMLFGSDEEQERVAAALERLRHDAPEARLLLRRLQPYLVSLYKGQAARYERLGLIEPILPGLGQWLGKYHPVRGLTGEDPDPDALVI